MTTRQTVARELLLQQAILTLRPLFHAKSYTVPQCNVPWGFASTEVKRGHIGQCWGSKASPDPINQIFISPALSDSVEVLDALLRKFNLLLHKPPKYTPNPTQHSAPARKVIYLTK